MTEISDFIRSLTTEVWAEIFQKRRLACVDKADDRFDAAAQINQQEWCKRIYTLDKQDQVVRECFRQLVTYITEVTSQCP